MPTKEQDERRRARQARWQREAYQKDPEKYRQASRESYHRHKEAAQARAAEWKAANVEQQAAYRKRDYAENRRKRIVSSQAYYQRNREKILAKVAAKREANKDAINEASRKTRRNNLARTMLSNCRRNAKVKGLPFNLTLDDIQIPTHCPVFGTELTPSTGKWCQESPSVDKIIPALGYVKGNIVVVSWKANRLKNNATIGDLQKLAAFYSQFA